METRELKEAYVLTISTDGYHKNRTARALNWHTTDKVRYTAKLTACMAYETLKEANAKLLSEYNEDNDKCYPNWGLVIANDHTTTHHEDGTYSYEDDVYDIATKRIDLVELRERIYDYAERYLSGFDMMSAQIDIENFVGYGIPSYHFRDFDGWLDMLEDGMAIPADDVEMLVDEIINL